jgi:hypothetical protein
LRFFGRVIRKNPVQSGAKGTKGFLDNPLLFLYQGVEGRAERVSGCPERLKRGMPGLLAGRPLGLASVGFHTLKQSSGLVQTTLEQAFESFRVTALPLLRGHGQSFELLLENLHHVAQMRFQVRLGLLLPFSCHEGGHPNAFVEPVREFLEGLLGPAPDLGRHPGGGFVGGQADLCAQGFQETLQAGLDFLFHLLGLLRLHFQQRCVESLTEGR